jgi:hypothetical protein
MNDHCKFEKDWLSHLAAKTIDKVRQHKSAGLALKGEYILCTIKNVYKN